MSEDPPSSQGKALYLDKANKKDEGVAPTTLREVQRKASILLGLPSIPFFPGILSKNPQAGETVKRTMVEKNEGIKP